MSNFVIHSTHELHQLKKALPLLRGGIIFTLSALSFLLKQKDHVIFVASVSHCGELALFIVVFSGKLPKYVAADPLLLSIHSSITRESKWRYVMKKVNLRDLYPDVYKQQITL